MNERLAERVGGQSPDQRVAAQSLDQRVAALCAHFERVARTRMAGIPILHPGLAVHAEGFEAEPGGRAAWGVLLTPWFMNLVRLPLAADEAMAPPGEKRGRSVGAERLEFIGAHDEDLGAYEICPLFSPMHEFVDQAAAVATAQAVLAELRRPMPDDVTAVALASPTEAPQPARRALLFGRASAPSEAAR